MEELNMLDDTEVLRERVIALEVGLRASKSRISKTMVRARRRVLAQRRDRLWLDAELRSVEAREAELRQLLPELRRRDRVDAEPQKTGEDAPAVGEALQAPGRSPLYWGPGRSPGVMDDTTAPTMEASR